MSLRDIFLGKWRCDPTPPKPSRLVKCAICGEEAYTDIMEGPVSHIGCQVLRNAQQEVEAKQAAEDRRQIDIIKQAMRELDAERTTLASSTPPSTPVPSPTSSPPP